MVCQRDWILTTASPWSQREAERQQVGRLLAPSGIMVCLHDKSPCPGLSAVFCYLKPGFGLCVLTQWVRSLGWEDPLEKGMAIDSSILGWRIPWKEKPGGLQSRGLQRVRHD